MPYTRSALCLCLFVSVVVSEQLKSASGDPILDMLEAHKNDDWVSDPELRSLLLGCNQPDEQAKVLCWMDTAIEWKRHRHAEKQPGQQTTHKPTREQIADSAMYVHRQRQSRKPRSSMWF